MVKSIKNATGSDGKNMNSQTKIKGIIFDLGGVIVEALGNEFLDYTSLKLDVSVKKLGEAVQKEEPPLERGEITTIKFWSNVCNKLGVNCPSKEILGTLWTKPYKQYAKVKEDTLALVKKLKGRYKLAILSNTMEEHNEINRKRGLFDGFDVVLLSNEAGMRKPEKEFFEAAAKKLNLSFGELLFVDDDIRWVEAARNYGLGAILFESAGQLEKEFENLEIRAG